VIPDGTRTGGALGRTVVHTALHGARRNVLEVRAKPVEAALGRPDFASTVSKRLTARGKCRCNGRVDSRVRAGWTGTRCGVLELAGSGLRQPRHRFAAGSVGGASSNTAVHSSSTHALDVIAPDVGIALHRPRAALPVADG